MQQNTLEQADYVLKTRTLSQCEKGIIELQTGTIYKGKKMQFSIVVAREEDYNGIGLDEKIPWRIPDDLKFFQKITTMRTEDSILSSPIKRNAIIMGAVTFRSLGCKALSERINIVISKNMTITETESLMQRKSLVEALETAWRSPLVDNVFVIGGSQVYAEAVDMEELHRVYITNVNLDRRVVFNRFFPIHFDDTLEAKFNLEKHSEWIHSGDGRIQFKVYAKKENIETSHVDEVYNSLVKRVLSKGSKMSDRTQIGTISRFGESVAFNLQKGFPILTTKRVFWKGIVEELLWFIRGSTNTKELDAKGVKIWNANTSRETLDKLGFVGRAEGDLGPGYGFQWRHYGTQYKDCYTDYTGLGLDQLQNVIDQLKENPRSRRIIMTSWNPKDVPQMSLPPCHSCLVQFLVDDAKNLTCIMTQRSCDIACGLPFNVSSMALFTHMVATISNLVPYRLLIQIGDAHIYLKHVNQIVQQIERQSLPMPTIKINKREKIQDFTTADIVLENYEAHPSIEYEMFV